MPKLPRPAVLAIAAAASVLVVASLAFGIHRLVNRGEVLGSVVVAGVEISGLSEAEARARVEELQEQLRQISIPVVVGSASFDLELGTIDYSIDTDTIIERALANGREGHLAGQFAWWLRDMFAAPIEIPLPYDYDQDTLDAIVRAWEVEGLADPPFPGEVQVVEAEVTFRYPARGTGIDRETAIALISASIGDPEHPPVELPTRLIDPVMTPEDVDRAVEHTRRLLGGGVTLLSEELAREIVIPREVLASAVVVTIDETALEPAFEFSLDPDPIVAYVDGFSDYLETEAVDAEILIDIETDEVTLVPSIPSFDVDDDGLGDAVWEAMNSPLRTGELPYVQVREADFSTADAEALGIRELIGEFTTHHPCCQRRVINIQLMADMVDDAWVMPGETWSLNEHVGQRTTAKGFVCAGALVGGELVEEGAVCIGGGTSQFTTTLHNAVFFAGLEHVQFTPHSAWFSRYPEGREATIGWRSPEYVFRNNTDNALVIRTTYTGSSITVKIYGDNGGLEVRAGLSNRFGHSAPVRRTRQNPDLVAPTACSADTAVVVQDGHGGWSVIVYRYITWPDGEETTEEWSWRYTGLYRISEYNPNQPECQEPDPPPDPPDEDDPDDDE
jgi:vancomycin resistance protein YoaR